MVDSKYLSLSLFIYTAAPCWSCWLCVARTQALVPCCPLLPSTQTVETHAAHAWGPADPDPPSPCALRSAIDVPLTHFTPLCLLIPSQSTYANAKSTEPCVYSWTFKVTSGFSETTILNKGRTQIGFCLCSR